MSFTAARVAGWGENPEAEDQTEKAKSKSKLSKTNKLYGRPNGETLAVGGY